MAKATIGLKATLVALAVTLLSSPAYARTASLKDAGIALWIFVVIGALIILLQLIPAALLFFSFIGTSSAIIFGRKKTEEEIPEVATAEYERATVEK